MKITLESIGVVRSPRKDMTDDHWGKVISYLEMDPAKVTVESLQGLAGFSHLEIIYQFHLVREDSVALTATHPRENPLWPKVGIFAQRKKNRPNRLGVSIYKIESVEGLTVKVCGLDALDGSPILDIKPHVREFVPPDREVVQPSWVSDLMKDYFAD